MQNNPIKSQHESEKAFLHNYIYDYLIKNNFIDSAKTFHKEAEVTSNGETISLKNPDSDKVDNSSKDSNNKSTIKKETIELPSPIIVVDTAQSFLLEWWTIFWDLYNAKGAKSNASPTAQQFLRFRQDHAGKQQHNGMSFVAPNGQIVTTPNTFNPNNPQLQQRLNPQISLQPGQVGQPNPSGQGVVPPHQQHGPHIVSHRNSPNGDDPNVPSHSPTPQVNSPNKRQRLSPEGAYVATGPMNQIPQQQQQQQQQQQFLQQPVINGQVNPMFQAAAMANGGIYPHQIPPAMLAAQQRQAMMNMNMAKGPGNQPLNPNAIEGSGPEMNDPAHFQQQQLQRQQNPQQLQQPGQQPGQQSGQAQVPGQRMGQNSNALADYQNQLMLLERVNQQRLTESGTGASTGPQRSMSTGGGNTVNGGNSNQQTPKQGANKTRVAASASPAMTNADIQNQRKGTPQLSKQQLPQQQQQQQQPPPPQPQQQHARSPIVDNQSMNPKLHQNQARNSPNVVGNNGIPNSTFIQGPNGAITIINGQPVPATGPQPGMWPGQSQQAPSPRVQYANQPPQQQQPIFQPQMPPPNGPITKPQPGSPAMSNPPTPKQANATGPAKGKRDSVSGGSKKRASKKSANANSNNSAGTPLEPQTPATPATPHNTAAPISTPKEEPQPTPQSSAQPTPQLQSQPQQQPPQLQNSVAAASATQQLNVFDNTSAVAAGQQFLESNTLLDDLTGQGEFDFHTFLNDDSGFDSNTAFVWSEGVDS